MSDIPKARSILRSAVRWHSADAATLRAAIRAALRIMKREKPSFRCRTECTPLNLAQRRAARSLRRNGMSVRRIAVRLGTNSGRVSEAINFKKGARRDR